MLGVPAVPAGHIGIPTGGATPAGRSICRAGAFRKPQHRQSFLADVVMFGFQKGSEMVSCGLKHHDLGVLERSWWGLAWVLLGAPDGLLGDWGSFGKPGWGDRL
jgi:hypothetical protein